MVNGFGSGWSVPAGTLPPPAHLRRRLSAAVPGGGFRVQGSGFRIRGSGFRMRGSGFRVQDEGVGCFRAGSLDGVHGIAMRERGRGKGRERGGG